MEIGATGGVQPNIGIDPVNEDQNKEDLTKWNLQHPVQKDQPQDNAPKQPVKKDKPQA